jgi:hypothetical protein
MIRKIISLVKQKSLTLNFTKYHFTTNFLKNVNPNKQKFNFIKQKITIETAYSILTKCKLEPKFESEKNIRAKYCPVCPKPHNEESTNLNTFVLYKDELIYYCYRCGKRGKFQALLKILSRTNNLQEFKNLYSDYSTTENEDYSLDKREAQRKEGSNSDDCVLNGDDINFNERGKDVLNTEQTYASNNKDFNLNKTTIIQSSNNKMSLNNISLIHEMSRRHNSLSSPGCQVIREYLLNIRKLSSDTLAFYKVGVSYEKFKDTSFSFLNLPTVSYPMFYPISDDSIIKIDKEKLDDTTYNYFQCDKFYLSKIKIRAIGKELKHFQRIEPTSAIVW